MRINGKETTNYKFDRAKVYFTSDTHFNHANIIVLNRLNGKIYLIVGNHDIKNLRQGYYDRFEAILMQMHIEIGKQKIYMNRLTYLTF